MPQMKFAQKSSPKGAASSKTGQSTSISSGASLPSKSNVDSHMGQYEERKGAPQEDDASDDDYFDDDDEEDL